MPSSSYNNYFDAPQMAGVPAHQWEVKPLKAAKAKVAKKIGPSRRRKEYISPRHKFAHKIVENSDEILQSNIDALQKGLTFEAIPYALSIHVVVANTRNAEDPKALIEIPCESLKPIGDANYNVQKDSVITYGIESHYLATLDFCYKIKIADAMFSKIIPLPENVFSKYLPLSAETKLSRLREKYPIDKGYVLTFVQFAGV